jgi:hypothetical protein
VSWKSDLDALIEQTMTLVRNVPTDRAISKPIVDPIEQVVADAPKPACGFERMNRPKSEREEIRQRVARFKAHQQKIQREREDYCTRTLAKTQNLLAPRRLDS